MTTHLFFPESQLSAWQAMGAARISGSAVTVTDPATRAESVYSVEPAVHVTLYLGTERGELDRDPNALAGRVVTLTTLASLGATFGEDTMRVGPSRYSMVPGHLAVARDAEVDHERVLSDLGGTLTAIGVRP